MKISLKSRRLLCVLAFIIIGALLTSCASPRTDATPQSIAQDILSQSSFSKMVEVTSEQLGAHLSIDPSALEDFCFYISTTEGSADEVGVFRAVDESSVVNLKSAISEHLMQLESRFENLDQAESDKIKKCIFVEYQQWVFLIITSNPEKSREVLTSYFPDMVFKG